MLAVTAEEAARLEALRSGAAAHGRARTRGRRRARRTCTLSDADLKDVALPGPEKPVSPRAGSEAAYVAHREEAREADASSSPPT